MTPENTKKLQDEFPDFFADLYGDPKKTCMSRGLEVGDGWFNIIYNLCAAIKVRRAYAMLIGPQPDFRFAQFKEKFGLLRINTECGSTKEISELINAAETESGTTCETCGTTENVTREGGWIKTLCGKCREDRKNKKG